MFRLKPPGNVTWFISFASAAVGIAFELQILIIPGFSQEPYSFWFVTAGYTLLALSNLFQLG